ncbi:DUF397 domain-containing protein [Actinomadura sp. NTSP31]|uniref:DUF397 domain-containing protein n=1 Tax=Actinomadura sp. NTSP31 TaxID=1735447 RepID=UPI0035C20C40
MTTWRKSSRSDETGGACVELARFPLSVAVRDSKDPEAGHLQLPLSSFAILLDHLKHHQTSN